MNQVKWKNYEESRCLAIRKQMPNNLKGCKLLWVIVGSTMEDYSKAGDILVGNKIAGNTKENNSKGGDIMVGNKIAGNKKVGN